MQSSFIDETSRRAKLDAVTIGDVELELIEGLLSYPASMAVIRSNCILPRYSATIEKGNLKEKKGC